MELSKTYMVDEVTEGGQFVTTVIASNKTGVIVRLASGQLAEVEVTDKDLLEAVRKEGTTITFDSEGQAINLPALKKKKTAAVKTGQGSTKLPAHL